MTARFHFLSTKEPHLCGCLDVNGCVYVNNYYKLKAMDITRTVTHISYDPVR